MGLIEKLLIKTKTILKHCQKFIFANLADKHLPHS